MRFEQWTCPMLQNPRPRWQINFLRISFRSNPGSTYFTPAYFTPAYSARLHSSQDKSTAARPVLGRHPP